MSREPIPSGEPPASSLRPSPGSQDLSRRINRLADGLVTAVARHWLMLFTLGIGLYVGLPFAAPYLMHSGLELPARAIYGAYSFTCHQLPDHSYFLFSDNATPRVADLVAGGMEPGLGLFAQRRFVGGAETGYKVALCQRDVAIYGSVVVAGLLFGLVRRRVKPLNPAVYGLLLIPIAVDGLSQLVGLRESNWWLRSLTGALFGAASVWLIYPYIQTAMDEVLADQLARQESRDSRP